MLRGFDPVAADVSVSLMFTSADIVLEGSLGWRERGGGEEGRERGREGRG